MSNRNIKDVSQEVSVSLPAAAANVNSASIDLGYEPGQIENAEIEIAVDETTALVDTKDVDVTLYDSADDSSFAAVAVFAAPLLKVTGVSGNGNDETKLHVRPARTIRRYIRINVATETAGGDVTAHEAHLRILF
jgi:hypothetical protein